MNTQGSDISTDTYPPYKNVKLVICKIFGHIKKNL